MSAYIVDDKTISKIVSYLVNAYNADPGNYMLWELRKSGVQFDTPKNQYRFAKRLYAMNFRGVYARYGNFHGSDVHSLKITPMFGISEVGAYKAIQCFLYQCTEGKVDEEPLYNMMRNIQNSIANQFLQASDAYNKAEWG